MKRLFAITLIVIVLLAIGGYYAYRSLMPKIVAEAVVSDESSYIPKRLQSRVEAMRAPINRGTEAVIDRMHTADIPMQQVLAAVDEISEDQFYAFLDDVDKKNPKTSDEVFDLAVKHFPTSFDAEVFRDPFTKHFKIKQIREAIAYANLNRHAQDIDIATAKAIVKNILVEKEKESSGTKQ